MPSIYNCVLADVTCKSEDIDGMYVRSYVWQGCAKLSTLEKTELVFFSTVAPLLLLYSSRAQEPFSYLLQDSLPVHK